MTDEFLEPWEAFVEENPHLPKELAREAPKGHPLFGVPVRAVGFRQDCDDVLFELLDGTGRVALVHLTWNKEKDPTWPWTIIYEHMEHWRRDCMERDHREWAGDRSGDNGQVSPQDVG